MVFAIPDLRAPEAIPSLTKLANEASDDFVRDSAKKALLAIKKLTVETQK